MREVNSAGTLLAAACCPALHPASMRRSLTPTVPVLLPPQSTTLSYTYAEAVAITNGLTTTDTVGQLEAWWPSPQQQCRVAQLLHCSPFYGQPRGR